MLKAERVRSLGGAIASRALAYLMVVLVVGLCATVLLPLFVVFAGSFWSAPFPRLPGSIGLEHYWATLSDPRFGPLLANTLIFAVGATVLAVALACLLAWTVTRTDVPAAGVFRLLPFASLLLPGMLKDISWIELYSPRTGLVNLALMNVFHLETAPFDIFTMLGMISSTGLTFVAIPYLILLGPMQSIDQALEEASRSSGAGLVQTIRRVTVPILTPALLSATGLTAVLVAAQFETPVLIGLPGGVLTFMSMLFSALGGGSVPNYDLASAQATLYLALTGVLLWWYLRSTRAESRFALVTGRGHRAGRVRLGIWRLPLAAIVLGHFVLSFAQLLIVAVLVSLVPVYTVTGGNPFKTLDLANYVAAWSSDVPDAIRSSILLSTTVSICAIGLATLVAYVSLKTRWRGRRLVELITTLPIGIPSLVLSVGLLMTVLNVPGLARFSGTLVPLVVADVIVFLPFAVRAAASAMISIHNELLEASAASGAGTGRTVRAIVIPLLAPALANAAVLVFVLSFLQLGAIVLLVTPDLELLPAVIFNLWGSSGAYAQVNALNVVSVLIPGAVLLAMLMAGKLSTGLRRLGRRSRFHPLPDVATTKRLSSPHMSILGDG